MKKYQPKDIEQKWQEKWKETKVFTPDLQNAKRPYYALMMFPYPSAEGLHVGNMYPFTAVDITARFKRMQGYDVFEPIGLDSFGIHSENYALKIGKNPQELTEVTAKRFYEQLMLIGNSYDWTRTLETHRPEYYKWTQWIFIQMYKEGLAVQKEASVNWCPKDMTVLADEQVIAGACERCGTEVEQKKLKQWFFKITEYSDKLLENLNSEIWSERIRLIQKNWIGKSEGALIKFDNIEVYTTRPDTIFGATFLVLSPEHPLVDEITIADQKDSVEAYKNEAKRKTDIERQENKDKTGVSTGGAVKNPMTGEEVPVWIADYVLPGYGTGAIMAVPAHDERDFEFAKKFNLPIKQVISKSDKSEGELLEAYTEDGTLINSGKFDNLTSKEAIQKVTLYIEEHQLGKKQVNFHLRDWLISRQRYWGPPIPMIYCDKCGVVPVPEEDLPVLLPETDNFRPTGTGKSPLAEIEDFVNTTCPKCGGEAKRETDVSDNFLDSAWYFFRYPCTDDKNEPFDKELIKKWLPVDIYIGGFEHALLHLMYTRFITMVFKRLGLIDFEEPFKRFIDNGHIISEGIKMSKSKGNVLNPDDYIKEYGADTLRMYLMFMAPLTEGGDFRKEAIGGIYRFLQRVWAMVQEIEKKDATPEELVILNKTIKAVTEDLETHISFNTPIARMMELLNFLTKQKSADPETLKAFLKLLAPFAPHITEELYQLTINNEQLPINEKWSIHQQDWPTVDEKYLVEENVNIVIQVNGRVRDNIKVDKNIGEEEVVKIAKSSEKVSKFLEGQEIKKTIFIPGKVLNLVV